MWPVAVTVTTVDERGEVGGLVEDAPHSGGRRNGGLGACGHEEGSVWGVGVRFQALAVTSCGTWAGYLTL